MAHFEHELAAPIPERPENFNTQFCQGNRAMVKSAGRVFNPSARFNAN